MSLRSDAGSPDVAFSSKCLVSSGSIDSTAQSTPRRNTVALFATVFLLGVLWAVESIEPELTKHFELKATSGDPASLRNDIESILRRYHVKFELRSLGQKELVYDTELPLHTRTDRIANAILTLKNNGETEVAWDEKKT